MTRSARPPHTQGQPQERSSRGPGISPQPEPPSSWTTLTIDSVEQLMHHEQEILQRIAVTPDGGFLFHIHPFMLLSDIGVALSERARAELVRRDPTLTSLSEVPYRNLKDSGLPQRIRVSLRQLL